MHHGGHHGKNHGMHHHRHGMNVMHYIPPSPKKSKGFPFI